MPLFQSYLACYQQPPLPAVPDPPPPVDVVETAGEMPLVLPPARLPLVPPLANEPEKSTKVPDPRIVAIEAEALALGWTHDQLWKQTPFWPEKGLLDILRPNQVITAMTASAIRLEETNGQGEVVVQHFYNPNAPQPWVTSNKLLHS